MGQPGGLELETRGVAFPAADTVCSTATLNTDGASNASAAGLNVWCVG